MKYQIWKTIEIGTPANSGSALLKEVRIEGHRISGTAEKVLKPKLNWGKYHPSDERFPVSRVRRHINLVKIPADEIGMRRHPKDLNCLDADVFIEKARELGVIPAPPETAPQYMLQYADQSPSEYLCFPFDGLQSCGDNIEIRAGIFTVVKEGTASVLGFLEDGPYFDGSINKLLKEFKVQFVFRVR